MLRPPGYLTPKQYGATSPWIFLAGPIQGAPVWPEEAITRIQRMDADINIASPRTPPPWHGDFTGQADWETFHLKLAARTGCILFWLANEEVHHCERAYAQTSRFELGEWFGIAKFLTIQLAVGIDDKFPNARYLRHRLAERTFGLDVSVCSSLTETCAMAVALAKYTCDRGDERRPVGSNPLELLGHEWLMGI